MPEHKGMGSLLLLGSIYAFTVEQKLKHNFISSLLLGLSIMFIGLGVFLIPWFFWQIFKQKSPKDALLFLAIVGSVVLLSLLPHLPEIFSMISQRLSLGNKGTTYGQGSPWVLAENLQVGISSKLKPVFTIAVFGLAFFKGYYQKNITSFTCITLLCFVLVYLTAGSLDRNYMAILVCIALYSSHQKHYNTASAIIVLSILYGIFGFIYLKLHGHPNQVHDASYCLAVLCTVLFYEIKSLATC
jgi:MFS family permease